MNEEKNLMKIEEKITKEKIIQYLDAFGMSTGLTEQEQSQFIEIAIAYQLNPFKREIYCIPFMTSVKEDDKWVKKKKLSIITGYEVYIKRAERLKVLDGWNVKTFGKIPDLKAVITIHRKDWSHPFEHEVWFREYNLENKIWQNKPVTMIKKVAVAQGFRMAFPDEFGGMPYTNDEMPDNMTKEIEVESQEIPENNIKTNEQIIFEKVNDFIDANNDLKDICEKLSTFGIDKKYIANTIHENKYETEKILSIFTNFIMKKEAEKK